MLAQRLPGILPPMSTDEALESAALQSVSTRGFAAARFGVREWRAPHHTASAVALVGGGSPPRPGEISLAHHGVLFLDELPEFNRHVLEVLREPLESGRITISRAAQQADFPARFQLVAAMNPCPCGYLGHYSGRCACSPDRIAGYRGRHLRAAARPHRPARGGAGAAGERPRRFAAGRSLRRPCVRAWRRRAQRQLERQGRPNALVAAGEVERCCAPDAAAQKLLRDAISRLSLSARVVPPRAQGGAHDRRSRGPARCGRGRGCGGDSIPQSALGNLCTSEEPGRAEN